MTEAIRLATLLQASLIADSLALPAHWIYDPGEIDTTFGRITDLIAPLPHSYHASQRAGGQTHYGEQALVLMDTLGAQTTLDVEAFDANWAAMWTDHVGYRDGATKTTLGNLAAGIPPREAGSLSHDLGGPARLAPLLVAMAGAPDEAVADAARIQTSLTHWDSIALDTAVFIVRAVRGTLAGKSVAEALEAAAHPLYDFAYKVLPAVEMVAAAHDAMDKGCVAAVQTLGAACAIQQALPAAMAIALAYPGDLELALIENVMAGGDSAARGLFLGMLLGAVPGATIPARWLARWQARERVERFLQLQNLTVC